MLLGSILRWLALEVPGFRALEAELAQLPFSGLRYLWPEDVAEFGIQHLRNDPVHFCFQRA